MSLLSHLYLHFYKLEMGKAKRLKVSHTDRTEGLDKQISKEEYALNKGRAKVSFKLYLNNCLSFSSIFDDCCWIRLDSGLTQMMSLLMINSQQGFWSKPINNNKNLKMKLEQPDHLVRLALHSHIAIYFSVNYRFIRLEPLL